MSGGIIAEILRKNVVKVIVKPSSQATKIAGYDSAREALRIDISEPPDKDKANKELIKFFNRLTGKKAAIISGMKSREKLLKLS